MSKNDMVMVPRDLAEAILGNASQGYFSKDHGDALRAALKAQQHQGEPVAWVRFRNGEPDYEGDACMISNVPGDTLGDGDSWEAVYTRHDSGFYGRAAAREVKKNRGLRAQLAEAQALLRDLDDAWNSHDGREWFGKLMQKVESLLASTEPSAPVERDELLTELAGLEINGDKPHADIPDDHDEYLDANASAALWLLLNVGRIRAAMARQP